MRSNYSHSGIPGRHNGRHFAEAGLRCIDALIEFRIAFFLGQFNASSCSLSVRARLSSHLSDIRRHTKVLTGREYGCRFSLCDNINMRRMNSHDCLIAGTTWLRKST